MTSQCTYRICASVLRTSYIIAAIAMLLSSSLSAASLKFAEIYDPEKVLDVKISVAEEDWNRARRQVRSMPQALGEERRLGKAESPFTYVSADVTINGVTFKGAEIRKKGFIGSLDNERPSLKVKLPARDENGTKTGIRNLTLNNNKQDGALVSQTMTYALFNQAGLVAPKTSYATVSVNGTSLGVYTNVEPARKALVKRGFGTDKGTMFEGTIVDFYPGWETGFEHKFGPEEAGRGKVKELVDALELKGDALLAAVKECVDLERFIRFWAVESLIGFWDGYSGNQNNFFVYFNPDKDRLHFLPWGADSVFTSRGMMDRGGPRSVKSRGRLAGLLYQIPEVQTRYREVMLELLDSLWNEEQLIKESERIEALVGDAIHGNQGGLSGALQRTRDFFNSRRDELMAELKDGSPEVENQSSEPMYFSKIGSVEGTIKGKWFDDTPSDGTAVGEADVKVFVDGEEVAFKNLGVYASEGRFGFPRGGRQAAINLVGERASDGETVTLMLMVPQESFAPSETPVAMGGMMREGQGFGFGRGGMQPLDGKIQFSAASQEDGAPVEASISGTVMRMVGGFFGRGRGGGGGRGPRNRR